jgi:hypothetical protein
MASSVARFPQEINEPSLRSNSNATASEVSTASYEILYPERYEPSVKELCVTVRSVRKATLN